MADSLTQDYRTKEDEEQESQKPKVRFADISTTAAWIAATYQAFSPESIRKSIQNEWVNKTTEEISRDPKFKELFARRKRNETRKEYLDRRKQQVEIRSLISDLVGAHSDQLFEQKEEIQKAIQQTSADLIKNDYQSLEAKQEDLLTAITEVQNKIATPFKEQNDKNNQRFEKPTLLYKRKPENLTAIRQKEKEEFLKQIIMRRKTSSIPKPQPPKTKPVSMPNLGSILRSKLPSMYESMGTAVGKVGGFLSKLPGIGGLFGGGAAAAGTAGAAGAAGAAGGAAAVGTAAGAAGAVGGAAVGAAGAAATVEIWGPILIVVTIVVLLGLLIALYVFNNPVVKPQALIPQPTSSPTVILPTVTPTKPYKTAGESLEAVMILSATETCTPLAMIKAISRREAGSVWNYSETEFNFYNSYPWWQDSSLDVSLKEDKNKICRGYGYDTCSNLIPNDSKFGGQYCKSGPISGLCAAGANVMGPMQFEQRTWNGYKGKVESILSKLSDSRQADRRVILDAFLAAGLKLHANSGATNCEHWTAEEIENAARRYYGKCIYTIGRGGNYCQEICEYYNEYSTQTVDCSAVGT